MADVQEDGLDNVEPQVDLNEQEAEGDEPEAATDEPHVDDNDAEGDDEPPVRQSRGEARFQKLANERAEALAKAQAAEQQAEFFRRQLEQRNQPPADDVYVDPDEKWRRDAEAKINQALFSANDLNDKATYQSQAIKNPLYSKFSDKVEAELMKIRAKGGNATREGVLAYIVGQEALSNAGKPTKTAQRATEKVQAARGNTPGMKSNVAQQRSSASLEERLSGQIL